MSKSQPTNTLARLGRREFRFHPSVTFLNHASFGPVPERGRRAIVSLLDRQGHIGSNPDVDGESFQMLSESRKMFARFVGARSSRVAFTPNTSYGLNSILWGLNLKANERILITEVEFPSVAYAVRSIAERLNLTIDVLPCPSGHVDIADVRRALKRRCAVLAISWVQFHNGYRYDLNEIAELCHDHGCFVLVDGMQGIGAVPLNMRRAGIDALACGTQKWLFGQQGGGFFAVADNPIRSVNPPFVGWMAYDWGYRWGRLQRRDRPRYHDGRQWELGSYPYYSVRLVHAGLSIIQEAGINNIFCHVIRLIDRLEAGLKGTRYRVCHESKPLHRSAICTIEGPRMKRLHHVLAQQRIFTSFREGTIRISPHFYNTDKDIDNLVKAVWSFDRPNHQTSSVPRSGTKS